jgi:hypothetical protein
MRWQSAYALRSSSRKPLTDSRQAFTLGKWQHTRLMLDHAEVQYMSNDKDQMDLKGGEGDRDRGLVPIEALLATNFT